ncbi:hypothetical protein PHLCEN_2v8115 [Hermanssonia centrifuga]|uniref:Uncharacterized protein n=1 Tax=Hermanssonia centrifuga TaxID=98765 RepID=A0A2R6NUL6_9APHY|nr:hypothetical protein PHLCEN_2v8115 [Hermanssonia centrifuga]
MGACLLECQRYGHELGVRTSEGNAKSGGYKIGGVSPFILVLATRTWIFMAAALRLVRGHSNASVEHLFRLHGYAEVSNRPPPLD